MIVRVLTLSVASAWLAWLWTREEIFRECQAYLEDRSQNGPRWLTRKLCKGLCCETCFVHWPILAGVLRWHVRLVEDGPAGLFAAWMVTAFAANLWLTLYSLLRVFRAKLKGGSKAR